MASKRPLLHVGYIKTGSTYLQNHVFNNRAFGFTEACDASRSRMAEELTLCNPYLFDPDVARQRLTEACPDHGSIVPVWSEEVMLGNPLIREYEGKRNAVRLQAVFPDARVLIVFREQRAMALSMYKEYINQGFRNSLKQFLGTGEEPMGFRPILDMSFMNYSFAISHYQQLFGPENVLALPFELFISAPDSFVRRISKFADADVAADAAVSREVVNKRRGAFAMETERRLNRFTYENPLTPRRSFFHRGLGKLVGLVNAVTPSGLDKSVEKSLKDQINNRFNGYYTDDNSRVSELVGQDLTDLGYM